MSIDTTQQVDPVDLFLDPVRIPYVESEATDLRDRAVVSLLRDLRDLLAVIAGAYMPDQVQEDPQQDPVEEVYIEDGRLKRRPVR